MKNKMKKVKIDNKLKAEIVRMRYERMTEDDMARWYDIEKMNELD